MTDAGSIAAPAGTWPAGAALPPEALYRRCDLDGLAFTTVDELPDPPGLVGQERAVEAVQFAIGMRHRGFNLFALGPSGTGRHTLVRDLLARKAAAEPTPSDWCYVNNFSDPRRPKRLRLPAGRARKLRAAMDGLVEELRSALPAAFEREEYRARRDVIDQQLKRRHQEAFGALQHQAEEKGIALVRTPMGLALAPEREGEVIGPEAFAQLSEEERTRINAEIEALQRDLEAIIRRVPEWEREHREALRQLNRETAAAAIGHLLEDLRHGFADLPEVTPYLDAVERDILENADDFLKASRGADEGAATLPDEIAAEPPSFHRYKVNVMVDNGALGGAPVIREDHATHQTLIGRIEHLARFGALVTDFTMIVPGACHRANGGYLVLDVERLLSGSFGYDALKRALRSGEIRIESLEQMLSLSSTVSLEPEPIPLDVKVVLIGPPLYYYLLSAYDPDFAELFKVAADFEEQVDRSAENNAFYARIIAGAVRREKLRSLDRGAVARTIEHASRLAGDAEKLSTQVRALVDLLQEADYLAGGAGKATIGADDIQAAVDAQIRRADRLYRRTQEAIGRQIIRIETSGERVGQINGLAVSILGGVAFGHPSRITAQIRLGEGEVIDIEREVALGGPLHSKGVLILSGFLGGRFGKSAPLSLASSLVFEQSYGGIDGDSASSAELYALLSALSNVPIRQNLAVTGSVDQHGQVQAIGGVNEKIEGFFDACLTKGLDGSQGVLIPLANVKHLMLRADVVEACAAGRFRVIPVATIDQGIELLTGVPAGQPDLGGNYPPGSVNHRIVVRLASFAARAAQEPAAKRRAHASRRSRERDHD